MAFIPLKGLTSTSEGELPVRKNITTTAIIPSSQSTSSTSTSIGELPVKKNITTTPTSTSEGELPVKKNITTTSQIQKSKTNCVLQKFKF